MKVLWLSMNAGLYGCAVGNDRGYGGGGWIGSLQRLLADEPSLEVGLVFTTDVPLERRTDGRFSYFPLFRRRSPLAKLREYHGGYRRVDTTSLVDEMRQVIDEFHPDLIHLFGIENPLANILGHTDVPVVIHLQGLIIPYANAFFPPGFGERTFLWPPSRRETLLRNGYVYDHRSILARAERERRLFGQVRHVMGRTRWDRELTALFAPQASYHHVDEMLRPVFCDHRGQWRPRAEGPMCVVSVLSPTVYKGLDLVLKTACLLASLGQPVEWHVVGLSPDDRLVRRFERALGIRSQAVGVGYHGVLGADELCRLELEMSLYVHPSYIDNSPNSLCEAQLLGLPVVATCVGGVPTLLGEDADAAQLVPANGVCELASAILHLRRHPGRAAALGAAGAALAARRHDPGAIRRDLLATYRQLAPAASDPRDKSCAT